MDFLKSRETERHAKVSDRELFDGALQHRSQVMNVNTLTPDVAETALSEVSSKAGSISKDIKNLLNSSDFMKVGSDKNHYVIWIE
jgi:hypothetical protein